MKDIFVITTVPLRSGSFEFRTFSTEQKVELFEFHLVHVEPIFSSFFHLDIFLQAVRYFLNVDPSFPRRFSGFDVVLFDSWFQMLIVNIQIFKTLIPTAALETPTTMRPITSGVFTSCSVNVGSSLGSIMDKFELVNKIKTISSFFSFSN